MTVVVEDLEKNGSWIIDPERIADRLFGGPFFICGRFSPDGKRFVSGDGKKMWFMDVVVTCWNEGLNYKAHKIG